METVVIIICIYTILITIAIACLDVARRRKEIEELRKQLSQRDAKLDELAGKLYESEHALGEHTKALTAMGIKPETKGGRKLNYAQIRHLNDIQNHREREHAERKADNTAYEEN